MMMTKLCSKCGAEKPVIDFYKQKGGKDGLRAACKKCFIKANTEYRARSSDKLRMGSKEYFRNLRKIKDNYNYEVVH